MLTSRRTASASRARGRSRALYAWLTLLGFVLAGAVAAQRHQHLRRAVHVDDARLAVRGDEAVADGLQQLLVLVCQPLLAGGVAKVQGDAAVLQRRAADGQVPREELAVRKDGQPQHRPVVRHARQPLAQLRVRGAGDHRPQVAPQRLRPRHAEQALRGGVPVGDAVVGVRHAEPVGERLQGRVGGHLHRSGHNCHRLAPDNRPGRRAESGCAVARRVPRQAHPSDPTFLRMLRTDRRNLRVRRYLRANPAPGSHAGRASPNATASAVRSITRPCCTAPA
mgnify:CR=1 FL=1